MVNTNQIAQTAAAVGEPARAAMLAALMDGRALNATELAEIAGVTRQTASFHLNHLLSLRLVKVEKQGRHRYHRLANGDVARMLEGLMQLAAGRAGSDAARVLSVGPRDEAMRAARTCYDHLAGRLGVAITDALVANGAVELDDDAGLLTDAGVTLLDRIGIALPGGAAGGRKPTRPLCRPCLDWSERRPHLAGQLGAAICAHCFERGWVRRVRGSRAVEITPKGRSAIREVFHVSQPL